MKIQETDFVVAEPLKSITPLQVYSIKPAFYKNLI